MRPTISPQALPERPHRAYIVAPCPFFAQGLAALLAPYLETHLLPSLQALSHDRQDAGPTRAIVCTGALNSQRLSELSQLVARLRRRHPAGP